APKERCRKTGSALPPDTGSSRILCPLRPKIGRFWPIILLLRRNAPDRSRIRPGDQRSRAFGGCCPQLQMDKSGQNTKKRVLVSQLKPGVYVAELDQSWFQTPLYFHRRLITDAS